MLEKSYAVKLEIVEFWSEGADSQDVIGNLQGDDSRAWTCGIQLFDSNRDGK